MTKDIFGIDFLPVSPSSEQTLTSEEDDVLPANTEDDKEEDEIEQENKMWLQTLDNVSEKKTALLLPVALATLLTLSYGTISVSGSLAAFLSSTISSSSPNSEQALLLKNIVLPTLITLPTLSISYFFSKYEVSNIFSSVINEKQSRVLSQVMAVLLVALSYSSWSVGGGLWSVHNIVNMCIAVTMSRLLQLEQLPFIVLALLGLTVYDVVAVFGTQQLTDGGQSIMEAVATAKISTASSAAPTIPSVDQASISSIASNWQWPKFRPWSPGLFEVSLNRRISDGLGLADVIFPSLLLTWAKRKEMITPPKVSAATACSTGFLIGCLMCEVFQTGQGQPALVFIVPSMLISLGLAVTTDSILKPKPEV